MSDDYCGGDEGTTATPDPARARAAGAVDGPFAECVLCRQPTEYPESHKGITLCPVCEWREAERTACSG
ncbi:hypothetical protein PV755_34495 [Streptomyces caniscabiei]|uniref:Uncharacterized protein n=1 Tax=Streptomyces caniscabiei TaxID=2746961 RepID=A0A927QPU6_9ACTN|nr:hypothetical protein [Streptomyces caniscabiei]MBD9728024.1 hypothetical protein [Streptomyces caniscabiei]MDX3513962.1 hypothetical protein [Streptomyces caniscabiei]MDX3722964.1 hypothetical protein [Streptomyces caniscabiei]WEO23510.1 hypothetical protein IHE65_10230 [Streptomyces caniscabiei]